MFTRTSLRRHGRNVASRIALEFAVVARVRSRDVKIQCFRVSVRALNCALNQGNCSLVAGIDYPVSRGKNLFKTSSLIAPRCVLVLCELHICPVKSLQKAGCFKKSLEQGLKSRQGFQPESLTFCSAVGLIPIVSATSGILPEIVRPLHVAVGLARTDVSYLSRSLLRRLIAARCSRPRPPSALL